MSKEPDAGRRRLLTPGPNQSWLELFYDLAFVAAIVVLSSSYSNNKTITHSAWLMIIAGMIWVAWLETTLLTNRTTLQRIWPRALTVAQMGLILVVAIAADDTIGNNTELVGPPVVVLTPEPTAPSEANAPATTSSSPNELKERFEKLNWPWPARASMEMALK